VPSRAVLRGFRGVVDVLAPLHWARDGFALQACLPAPSPYGSVGDNTTGGCKKEKKRFSLYNLFLKEKKE
jgi:hypothetical protein